MPTCPSCSSEKTVKNGHINHGKQRFKCCGYSRQFVENPDKIKIDRWSIIGAIALHLISAWALYLLAATGISNVGYVLAA